MKGASWNILLVASPGSLLLLVSLAGSAADILANIFFCSRVSCPKNKVQNTSEEILHLDKVLQTHIIYAFSKYSQFW